MTAISKPLSNIQMELLKLYSMDIDDNDLLHFKNYLAQFFINFAQSANVVTLIALVSTNCHILIVNMLTTIKPLAVKEIWLLLSLIQTPFLLVHLNSPLVSLRHHSMNLILMKLLF